MPIYNYRCIECRQPDQRIAGLDDHQAVCHVCRGVMLREEADIFKPYFETPDFADPASLWPPRRQR